MSSNGSENHTGTLNECEPASEREDLTSCGSKGRRVHASATGLSDAVSLTFSINEDDTRI